MNRCLGHVATALPSSVPLLSRKEAAALLNRSVWTLAQWARDGVGPRFYRDGYSPHQPSMYRREDVFEFDEQRRRKSGTTNGATNAQEPAK